jgi:hypothetical protein
MAMSFRQIPNQDATIGLVMMRPRGLDHAFWGALGALFDVAGGETRSFRRVFYVPPDFFGFARRPMHLDFESLPQHSAVLSAPNVMDIQS